MAPLQAMIDATRTTTLLLQGLFDADNEAVWAEFDARYRPLLIGFACRLGLGEDDARDVAQETLLQFVSEYRAGRYDRERGRLRSWLIGIARARVAAIRRSRARKRETRGESAIIDLANEAALSEIWDAEQRTMILREALSDLRTGTRASDVTIRAFELLVLRNMSVAAVARELDMSSHDVYLAKSRMAKRLRGIIERLELAFDEPAA